MPGRSRCRYGQALKISLPPSKPYKSLYRISYPGSLAAAAGAIIIIVVVVVVVVVVVLVVVVVVVVIVETFAALIPVNNRNIYINNFLI